MIDLSKNIKSLETTLIIAVLKYATDKEHPLSAAKIALYLSNLSDEIYNIKTVFRKLRSICAVFENAEEESTEFASQMLAMAYGGFVRSVSTTQSEAGKKTKPQYKFYFEPLLKPDDMSKLCNMISSNHNLTSQEKEYYLAALHVTSSRNYMNSEEIEWDLPELPVRMD